MSIIGKSISISCNVAEVKQASKLFVDANVHDGEDRSGCDSDAVIHTPDQLQEIINDLIDHLFK